MTASEVSVGAWAAFAALAGPILLLMLVIGLAAGILQTATQIREASIPFILKMSGLAVLTSIAGPLIMQGVERFARHLILAIPALIHG
jgi:flagellar biosynthesis protein FliQ